MRKLRRLPLALGILALVTGGLTITPSQSEALICPHYFCRNNTECRQLCPSAAAAGCVDNVCQYTW